MTGRRPTFPSAHAPRLLECMTQHPGVLDQAFVAGLRADGLDDPAIREAANVGFHYNLINRIADAFDFPVTKGIQTARLASILNTTGKLIAGSAADPVWVRGEDGRLRPTEVEHGRTHLLSAQGVTAPELRRSVEAFVALKWGVARPTTEHLPAGLTAYLEKLALHAYTIFDKDVEALCAAGYQDEHIYEITLVGAFGAALVGLEQLFDSLYGGGAAYP